jgi:hypothetical protein
MIPRILFSVLLMIWLPLFHINGQSITVPDEVEVDSLATFTHTFPPGSYYWIATGATVVTSGSSEISLSYPLPGFYRVQLWSHPADTFIIEKPVVAGNPPMFDYAYDAAGNRVSRQIVYYDSSKKSAKGMPDEKVMPEDMAGGFNVYPNPAREVLYVSIPPDNEKTPGEWEILLFDSMGRICIHQKAVDNINELDISGIRSGYYILRVAKGKARKEWRLIKN